MTIVAFTLALVFAVVAVVVLSLRRTYVQRALGWRLLAHAGWPLILAGALFVGRFWTPTPGPYLANVRYPFGDYLAAWAVSFGFTWIAFGLLFGALAVLAPADTGAQRGRLAWLVLLATWALCWLPHGIIGVAVVLGGLEAESITQYATWARRPLGALTLAAELVLLALHFSFSLAGFVVAGSEVWRAPRAPTDSAPVPRAA